MKKCGCIHCQDKKNSFHWSSGVINPPQKIFYGSYLTIVELLEAPYKPERYLTEQVLQCEKCNTVWHILYYYPDRPPLTVNAKIISKSQLKKFFIKIGEKLSKTYTDITN